jgi:hypothetical protein
VAVALSSRNPAPTGTGTRHSGVGFGNDGFFRVRPASNTPAVPVTIPATLNGQSAAAKLTIVDQIRPGTSQTSGNCGKYCHLLMVAAATSSPGQTLRVFVSGTTQLTGAMTHLGQGNPGHFFWPVNPGYPDIRSSGGATLTVPIPTVNR